MIISGLSGMLLKKRYLIFAKKETGYTTDVEKRLQTHNAGKGAKYTRNRLPVSLLYQEAFASKPEAMSAEALFKKRSRQSKLDYIAHHK